MRVVVAPDKFKGSLDALGVATALAGGIRDVVRDADVTLVPMADGGDGTVDAFLAGGAAPRGVRVRGPLGAPVEALYALDGDLAVLEMAAASGLVLVAGTPAPRDATTWGTGELIGAALAAGARRIVLGIGGSATTDGGAGMLAALGVRFLDAHGAALEPTPRALAALDRVDASGFDARLRGVAIRVACDVDNPLLGPSGAAAVYGPQKGAGPDDVAFLDRVLERLADVVARDLGRDERARPGAGAAGGIGWALATVLGATLERGVDLVADVRGLDAALEGARWVFTGEGRIDEQTTRGKVVDGVAARAQRHGARTVAFAGSVDPAAERTLRERGIACVPIVPGPLPREVAMRDVATLVRAAGARVALLALV